MSMTPNFDLISAEFDFIDDKKAKKAGKEEERELNLSSPDLLNHLANGRWTLFCLQHSFTAFSIVIALSVILIAATRVYHLLAPESWSWMTFSQLSDLDKLITFVAIGITARYFPVGKTKKVENVKD